MQLERLRPPLTGTLEYIPDGPAGTRATLLRMRDLIRAARTQPVIREQAAAIVSQVRAKNWPGEASAIQQWVQRNIRYTKDVRGVETLTDPVALLDTRQEDCDGHTMLTAALLEAVGHPTRLVAVGKFPWSYQHVFAETRIGPRWLAVETTQPYRLGQQPKSLPVRMVVTV